MTFSFSFFFSFFIFLFLFLVVAVCCGMARGAAEGSLIRLFSFSFFVVAVYGRMTFFFFPLFLFFFCCGSVLAYGSRGC